MNTVYFNIAVDIEADSVYAREEIIERIRAKINRVGKIYFNNECRGKTVR